MDDRIEPSVGGLRHRVIGVVVLLVALTPLLCVQTLRPTDSGPQALGTHTQAGLPPCSFEQSTSLPCPTCGVTTAFTHAAQGRPDDALATQPLGFTLALFLGMAAVWGGWAAWTAMPIDGMVSSIFSRRFAMVLIAVMLLGWIYRLLWAWWSAA